MTGRPALALAGAALAGSLATANAVEAFDARGFLAPLRAACLSSGLTAEERFSSLAGWRVLDGAAAVAAADRHNLWAAVRRGFDYEELFGGSPAFLSYFREEVERRTNPTSIGTIEEEAARSDGSLRYLEGPEGWEGRIFVYDNGRATSAECIFWTVRTSPEVDAALIGEIGFLDPLTAPFGRLWSAFGIGPGFHDLQLVALVLIEPGAFTEPGAYGTVPPTGFVMEIR